MTLRPARRLVGQPGHRAVGILLQHAPEGEPALPLAVTDAEAAAGVPERAAGEHHPRAHGGEDAVEQQLGRARVHRAGGLAQGEGEAWGRGGAASLRRQGPTDQPGPRRDRGRPEIDDGIEVAGNPRPQVLPEQHVADPFESPGRDVASGRHRRVTQLGVERQQHAQVVWLRWRVEAEHPPEAGDPVGGVSPELPLVAEVDGGVRGTGKDEGLGAVRGIEHR